MKIGDIARATGLTVPTIRYYEQQGILPRLGRTESGYRVFGADDLQRLEFVKQAKRLGLSLTEIGDILAVQAKEQPTCLHVRAMLESKIATIERTLRELHDFRDHLQELVDDSADLEDCRTSGGRICKIIEQALFEANLLLLPEGQ